MLQKFTRHTHIWGRIFFIIIVGVFLFFSSGCSEETDTKVVTVEPVLTKVQSQTEQNIFQSITAVEAQAMMKNKEGLLLVDVRTPQEIKQMKIAGSLSIPVGDVIRGKFVPAQDSPIILVCAVGGRSYIAGRALASRGYREIYNLDGGIEAWRRAGLPLEVGWK